MMSLKSAGRCAIVVVCLVALPACPPPRPADAILASSPIVGFWEGSIILEDATEKTGVALEFAPTSLVAVGLFGGRVWVTWATLYEDDVFQGDTDYSFRNGVASMDGDLFSRDVSFGSISATLTLSEDERTLTGPISYGSDTGGPRVSGTLTATKRE